MLLHLLTLLSKQTKNISHVCRLHLRPLWTFLLCVNDGKTAVELPAHSTVLSGHSSVMCDMLHSVKPNATHDAEDSSNSLRVPMVGETLLEVQTLLDMVYSSFGAGGTATPQRPVEHQVMAIMVAHKYGMTKLVADLEVKFIRRVEALAPQSTSGGPMVVAGRASSGARWRWHSQLQGTNTT